MFRMPIFTWNALLTSMLVLLAFPVLAAALLVLEVDRRLGAQVFSANSGWALLRQHLFWFFGHPEVYILASPPMNFAVSGSYFVAAHFHYVLAGTVLFATFAGFYFWWPKMTGKMLNPRLGKTQFWFLFVGFQMTFLVQHWTGVQGQVRRTANYPLLPGDVITLNIISSVGSWLLAVSVLLFIWNVYVTMRFGRKVTEEDPWGFSSSLEWATSCPPPRHNFYRIPRIRSERPAFEAHYPRIKTGRASRGIEQIIPAISNGEPRQELSQALRLPGDPLLTRPARGIWFSVPRRAGVGQFGERPPSRVYGPTRQVEPLVMHVPQMRGRLG